MPGSDRYESAEVARQHGCDVIIPYLVDGPAALDVDGPDDLRWGEFLLSEGQPAK